MSPQTSACKPQRSLTTDGMRLMIMGGGWVLVVLVLVEGKMRRVGDGEGRRGGSQKGETERG